MKKIRVYTYILRKYIDYNTNRVHLVMTGNIIEVQIDSINGSHMHKIWLVGSPRALIETVLGAVGDICMCLCVYVFMCLYM